MAGRTGPRGEYAKTQRRREEILAAAFSVFGSGGFLNSTMSEIAKQAGITMPGLTYYFPTKAGLLAAVLDERDLDAVSHLEGRRGVELMRGLVEVAARDESDDRLTQLFTVLSAEATTQDHPAHEYFTVRYRLILDSVRRALEDAKEDGALDEGVNPVIAASMYAAVSDGFPLQRLYDVAPVSQATMITSFFSQLLTPLGRLQLVGGPADA